MLKNARVAMIVVTSNHREVVGALIQSMERSVEPVSLTIIDQASSDQTSHWLRETYPAVMGFRNFHDVGKARALNQGVAFALSKWAPSDLPYRYIAFTTPDAVWDEAAVGICTRFMDSDHSLSAVVPVVLLRTLMDADDEDDLLSDRIISAGAERTSTQRIVDRKSGELLEKIAEKEEVFCGSGRAVLVRASVFTETGMGMSNWFESRIPDVMVEQDFFWGMHAKGLKTACASLARVSIRSRTDVFRREDFEMENARGWRLLMWRHEAFSARWHRIFPLLGAIVLEWLRCFIHPSRFLGILRAWGQRWALKKRVP